MANSQIINPNGPFWPLGNITVPTPGTPVRITSLIDPSSLNAPENPTSVVPATATMEYTVRANQILFFPFKGAGATKLIANTGTVYVILFPLSGTTGTQTDRGVVIAVLRPTDQPFKLESAALNRNDFSPYQIYLDADTANDGASICLVIA